jgi:hypothetical protein
MLLAMRIVAILGIAGFLALFASPAGSTYSPPPATTPLPPRPNLLYECDTPTPVSVDFKTGKQQWVQAELQIVRRTDGKVVGKLGITQDGWVEVQLSGASGLPTLQWFHVPNKYFWYSGPTLDTTYSATLFIKPRAPMIPPWLKLRPCRTH